MSTTTARHRATGHAAGRPVARRATKASALALAVTIPFGALTAAPAHATMMGAFTTDPQFDGTVMRHNAIVNLIFSMVPSQDTMPGDSTEHYLSPGYAPSWEGALKIFTTDGKHHIATIRKIDSDSFRITWEEAIRNLSNPTANVTLPIGYEYGGDLINGLKPNAYNPLLVDGKETGASFYFTKLRQLSNGAVLYAYTQLETGKVRLGPVAQVARSLDTDGDVTATFKSDGNWAPDCANPVEVIWSDDDITDGSWDGPDLASTAIVESCTPDQLVVRVPDVQAGVQLSIRTQGWATKAVSQYSATVSFVDAAGTDRGPYNPKATPGSGTGVGDGTSDMTTGTVFWDSNQNGARDEGEEKTLAGAQVALHEVGYTHEQWNGTNPTQYVTTDENGSFESTFTTTKDYQVTLVDPGPNGHPGWKTTSQNTVQLTGTDAADIHSGVDFGMHSPPGIVVEKGSPEADFGATVQTGTELPWTYRVYNSGLVDLERIKVTDDLGSLVTCPLAELPVYESMVCTGKGIVTSNATVLPEQEAPYQPGANPNDRPPEEEVPVPDYNIVVTGNIYTKWQELGGEKWGVPVTAEMDDYAGSTYQQFRSTSGARYTIFNSPENGAHLIGNAAIWNQFNSFSDYGNGFQAWFEAHGTPSSAPVVADRGVYQDFTIGTKVTRLMAIQGEAIAYQLNMGGAMGRSWELAGGTKGYGYPITDEVTTANGIYQDFRNIHGEVTRLMWAKGAYAYPMHGDGEIAKVWEAAGGMTGKYGFPTSDRIETAGGYYQDFANGSVAYRLAFTETGGLRETVLSNGIGKKYMDLGGADALGLAVTDRTWISGGYYQDFRRNNQTVRVVWRSETGLSYGVRTTGQVGQRWLNTGGTSGTYGWPTSDLIPDGSNYHQSFTTRTGTSASNTQYVLSWTPETGVSVIDMTGSIAIAWRDAGGVDALGVATTDRVTVDGGYYQDYIKGTVKHRITWSSAESAHLVKTSNGIGAKYINGGADSKYGFAANEEYSVTGGAQQNFTKGTEKWAIAYSSATGSHAVRYDIGIGLRWSNAGGTGGYGFPVSDEVKLANGNAYQDFRKGSVVTRINYEVGGKYTYTTL